MKIKGKRGILIIALVVFSGFLFLTLLAKSQVEAAALTSAYTYMSRNKAALTTGNEMVFVLTPSVTTNGSDTITITFPDSEDGQWCYTGGGATLTSTVDMSGYIDVLEAVVSLTGTPVATCTAGSGAGSYDTITVTGVGALVSGTAYGFKVVGNLALLGTATTAGDHILNMNLDDGGVVQVFSFGVDLIADDQVVVSATIADVDTVNCVLSTNTLNLGSLFKGGAYVSNTHTFEVSTSANADGYYVAAWGTGDAAVGNTNAGLYNAGAPYLIESDFASNTIDLNTNEGYGLRVSDPDAGGSSTVYVDFSNGTSTVFGTLGNTTTNAKVLFSQTAAEVAGDTSTITHGAAAGTGADAGSYQETVTFMCGGFY
jgi:hypothetical protein